MSGASVASGGDAKANGSIHAPAAANGIIDRLVYEAADLYTEQEIAFFTKAFDHLAELHRNLHRQIDSMREIGDEVNTSFRSRARVQAVMQSQGFKSAAPPQLSQSIHMATFSYYTASSALLLDISQSIQAMQMRIEIDRLRAYSQLARVPAPPTIGTTPVCHERCALRGKSLGGGVLAGQRCCGALVCSACLHLHNFEQSNQARFLHAPCFNCGKLRRIFNHIDGAEQQQSAANSHSK